LGEALKVSQAKGLPRYDVLQPEYNLYDRAKFDGPLRDLCMRDGLGVVTYFSLASGFLSGKYRSREDLTKSKRGGAVGKYLDSRGLAVLKALDQVSETHGAKPAEVALAWIIARPGVFAPIVSATSVDQVESFAKAARPQA
jgi:aryl-alcohol dehydrogenase-like predicted oxidoreductase